MNQPLFSPQQFTLLSDAQRLDWLQLIRSENVGPRTFRALVNRFGGVAAALEALPALIRAHAGARKIGLASRDACKREMDRAYACNARFVALGEAGYPQALRVIDDPPPLLAVRGSLATVAMPAVAIVGSRNASAAGLSMTSQLAREIGAQGYAIVSGLARGIDQQAHRATLQTGTLAVLAGGLDKIYPPDHEGLADAICEHGALISEMPFGWTPRGRDFPRRNRIVSGIALGTVVIEAALRSGSLITARFANEQGREVFAVPGSPLDPRAEGANDLIRQGATFCTRAADVIEALAPLREGGIAAPLSVREDDMPDPKSEPLWDEADVFDDCAAPQSRAGLEMNEQTNGLSPVSPSTGEAGLGDPSAVAPSLRIEDLLGPTPVALDDLVRACGLPVADVQMALVELELRGRLERLPGGLVALSGRQF